MKLNLRVRRDEIISSLTEGMRNLGFDLGYEPDPAFLTKAMLLGTPEWGAVKLMAIGDWAFSEWPSLELVQSRVDRVLKICDEN